MATFTAYKQVNMDMIAFLYGQPSIATATHLQLKTGAYVQNYYGSFSYSGSGNLTGGQLTSTDFSQGGVKMYALSGGNYSITATLNFIQTANFLGLLQFLFAGNDTINGSAGADVLSGYAGNDAINGNVGNDTLKGGAGNDTLNGGSGADNMVGGDGSDLYYVDNGLDIVTETNAIASTGGIDTTYSYLSNYSLKTNIENGRIVSAGSANLSGNSLNNLIYAGAGVNKIDGLTGVDTVSYGYATTTGTAGVTLNLLVVNASGQSTASGISGADLVKNIENINGSNYADILVGNDGKNVVYGGAGNDLILGAKGNDTLIGGAGKDTFRINTTINSSTNKDTISDFNVVDDTIQLENGIFTKLLATGVLAAGNFRASAAGTAVDANDYVLYKTTTGVLSYDADGNGAGASVQISTIGISVHPALTNADFMVI